MRIGIIGDAHKSGGGAHSWAAQFANIIKEFGVKVDYIGDRNFDKDNKLYNISVKSDINSFDHYQYVKTPAEVLLKMGFCQRRLYEQLGKKIYDAYIVQRFDFYPVLQSLGLSEKVPIFIPNHDISAFEQIITPSNATTEAPYRIVPLMESLLSGKLNILSSSEYLGDKFKEHNSKLSVKVLSIPLHDKIRESTPNVFNKTKGVLWVGSQVSYKNPNLMFEIVKAMPDMQFTMVFNTKDPGTFTKISKKFKALNLKIYPSIPLDDLIKLYQEHRIGIITSDVETFCIVAQEQLCFHPTLVYAKSCNKYHKIFEDNMIPFDNIREAVDKINEIYSDSELYNSSIRKTKEYIVNRYSFENVKEEYRVFTKELKDSLIDMNKFKAFNTMGSFLNSRLGLLNEVAYEDLLREIEYNDNTLAQLSMLSQLSQFKRKEYNDKTVFVKQ